MAIERERAKSPPQKPAAAARHDASRNTTTRAALRGLSYDEQCAALCPDEPPVQAKGRLDPAADVHAAAGAGVQGSGGALPNLGRIQASFGAHDVSQVQAYAGGPAADATRRMGADAYATGDKVAFRDAAPTLHTAAHEAAHVVQQRAGVSLPGGVGATGDGYERHADAVADKVVQGRSAEPLLDQMTGSRRTQGAAQASVQRAGAVQFGGKRAPPFMPVEVSNKITDAPFKWQSKYDVKFTDTECLLVIRAKFDPQPKVTKQDIEKVGQRASAVFTKIWDDKFVLTDAASGKQYALRASVKFVESGQHYTIKLHPGGDGSTSGNLTKWYVGWPDVDYAHELGHQLGLKDEYIDKRAPARKDAKAPGVHKDHSIMGNYYAEGKGKAESKLRHGKQIGAHVSGKTGINFVVSKKS